MDKGNIFVIGWNVSKAVKSYIIFLTNNPQILHKLKHCNNDTIFLLLMFNMSLKQSKYTFIATINILNGHMTAIQKMNRRGSCTDSS